MHHIYIYIYICNEKLKFNPKDIFDLVQREKEVKKLEDLQRTTKEFSVWPLCREDDVRAVPSCRLI